MDESLIRSQPVVRVCKLRALPFGQSDANEDIFFQDGLIRLHDPKAKRSDPPKEYPVDFVHGPLASSEDVAARDLPRLVDGVLAGNDGFFICIGSDDAGKSQTLDGPKGICNEAIRMLFTKLSERKNSKLQNTHGSSYSFTMKMRYYELYNEYINDLFTEKSGQVVQVLDTIDGVQVKGLSGVSVSSVKEAQDTLGKIQSKRNKSTKNKTHTILQLEVTQADHKQAYGIFAKLLIVKMAALDFLVEDRDVVQLKEGFNACRSIFTFNDLIYSWTPKQIGEVSTSLLTWILHDLFAGGNVLVVFLLCIQHMQYPISLCALDLMKALIPVRTNPVPYDNKVAALTRCIRTEWLQTKQNLASLQQYAQNVEIEEKVKKHIHDLEGRVLEEEIGRVKALEEKRFLQNKVEELKEKYKTAIISQAETQKARITSEEERLKVSQALVTLQIKMTNMQNDLSEQQYKDTAKIVTFEQDLVDLTNQNKKKAEQLEALEEKWQASEKDRKALEMEYLTSKNNYLQSADLVDKVTVEKTNLTEQLDKTKTAKNELAKLVEALQMEASSLKAQGDDNVAVIGKTNENISGLQARLNELEKELSVEKTLRLKKEVELEKMQAHFAFEKVDMEKNSLQFVQKNELDLQQFKSKKEEELTATAAQVNEISKIKEEIEKENKTMKRMATEAEHKRALAKAVEEATAAANRELEKDLSTLKRDFQSQLTSLLTKEKGGTDPGNFVDARYVDDVLAKMVAMVNQAGSKEKDLFLKQQKLQDHNRALEDQLVFLHHLCLDWAPPGELELKDKVVKVLETAQEEARKINDSRKDHDKTVNDANRILRSELELERKTSTEDKLNLSKQIKKLQMEVAQNNVELLGLRKFKDEMEGSSSLQHLPQVTKMQRQVLQEVEALRRGDKGNVGNMGNDDSNATYQELLQKCTFLRSKVERLSAQTPAEHKALQQRVDFLEKNLHALESERSQLLVRCTVAEEQLEQFQVHMKQMMTDYQKQIASMKSFSNDSS